MQVVNAGPGSGKTTKALDYIVDLLSLEEVKKISYITITNAAADDARERAKKLISEEDMSIVTFTTMHSAVVENCKKICKSKKLKTKISTSYFVATELREMDLPSQSPGTKESWLKCFYDTFRTGDSVIMPLEYCVEYLYANDFKAPEEEYIIIDEYQDMYAREINTLVSLYNRENVYITGDTNQQLFQFRMTEVDDIPINIDTEPGMVSRILSHRLYQDSCDTINCLLEWKKFILGYLDKTIPIQDIVMVSSKQSRKKKSIEPIASANFYRAMNISSDINQRIYSHTSRDALESIFDDSLYSIPLLNRLARPSKKLDLIIVGQKNAWAGLMSTSAINRYGMDSIYHWYTPAYMSLLYQHLKYFVSRGSEGAQEFITEVVPVLRNMGIRITSLDETRIFAFFTLKRKFEIKSNHPITVDKFIDRLNMISLSKLPSDYVLSEEADMQSNRTACMSILNGFVEKGLGVYNTCIRSYREKNLLTGPHSIGVYTIHSSKGIEADYVILDSTSWTEHKQNIKNTVRPTREEVAKMISNLSQTLNMIYVAMSRQKERLFVVMKNELSLNPNVERDKIIESIVNWMNNFVTSKTKGRPFPVANLIYLVTNEVYPPDASILPRT